MTKTQTTSTVRDALTGHFGATERTIRVNGKRVTVALTDKTAAALKDKNFRESKAERLLDKGEVVGAAYNRTRACSPVSPPPSSARGPRPRGC